MKIYVHKVRMNPIDGWGNSIGVREEVLGNYATYELAMEAKNKRDLSPNHVYCDVGNSWISKEDLEMGN